MKATSRLVEMEPFTAISTSRIEIVVWEVSQTRVLEYLLKAEKQPLLGNATIEELSRYEMYCVKPLLRKNNMDP
jgi:hypothetical protein